MKLKKIAWTLPAALFLVLGGLVLASCRTGDVGLVDGRLRDCPATPNCVCSEIPEGPQSIDALDFTGDPDAALGSLVTFLREQPRVDVSVLEQGYVHAVFRTRWLRFRDDVEFRLDRDAQRIHVRSASRVGFSDLGANRARVEWIRERWSSDT